MTETLYVRFRLRGRTAAEWTSLNEVLLGREMGLETDTRKFKFGDGSTAWNSLPYAAQPLSSVLTFLATASTANAAGVKTLLALVKGDVGLGNVDNTADTAKPVSTAQQTALNLKINTSALDTDGTLAANSDAKIATQKAVKTYVDMAVTGLLDFKGSVNCSGNPNYPAALKGDAYVVSAAGRIGGGSGAAVDVGDVVVASADNAGGTQAAVGTSWFILEHNLAGALLTSDLGVTVQGYAAALAQIAALSPANDDVLQLKSGSWVNRTMAQLRTDLFSIAVTIATILATNIKDSANAFRVIFNAGGNTTNYSPAAHQFANATGGTVYATINATGLDVLGEVRGDSLRIDSAAVAGTPTPTHYLTINVNGTTYKVLLAP